jgi:flagellar basal-body rod modification protein FlgD
MTTTLATSGNSSAPASTSTASLPTQTLTQANFLQLLVTQMSSQDPLNPESDTDFAAQLAQFSSLQETQTMQGNLSQMQADSLIGQTVSLAASSGSAPVTGTVSGIQISAGTPEVVVGGVGYPLTQITAAALPTTAANATQTTTPN